MSGGGGGTITCTLIPPASPGHQLNSIIHSVLFRSSVVSKIHAFSWAKIPLPFYCFLPTLPRSLLETASLQILPPSFNTLFSRLSKVNSPKCMGSKGACSPFKTLLLRPIYFENAVIFFCPFLEGRSFPQNSKLSPAYENVYIRAFKVSYFCSEQNFFSEVNLSLLNGWKHKMLIWENILAELCKFRAIFSVDILRRFRECVKFYLHTFYSDLRALCKIHKYIDNSIIV